MKALPGPIPRMPPLHGPDAPAIGGTVVMIILVVVLTVGSFAAWSALAHIAAAIPAVGRLGVETNRKEIQHLEGGIVRHILVQDGEVVDAGTPLLVLDDTRPGAELGVLRNEFVALSAARARLLAELAEDQAVRFDDEFVALADEADAADYLETQRQLFRTRKATVSNTLDINRRRLDELSQQVAATEAQRAAAREQLRLISEELIGTRELFEEGYAPKTKVLALERTAAGLQGNVGALSGRLAELRETIEKVNLETLEVQNVFRNETIEELKRTETELKSISERMGAKIDTVSRTVVRAPESGIVQNIRFHTVGGVVGAGEVMMEIVPQEDRLIAEVQVRPQDIEAVFPGRTANVYIIPYQTDRIPPIAGLVTYVSPDIVTAESPDQEPYYEAKVALDPDSLRTVRQETGMELPLYPGMPVQTMIVLRERTVLDYLIQPIYTVVEFGMREE